MATECIVIARTRRRIEPVCLLDTVVTTANCFHRIVHSAAKGFQRLKIIRGDVFTIYPIVYTAADSIERYY